MVVLDTGYLDESGDTVRGLTPEERMRPMIGLDIIRDGHECFHLPAGDVHPIGDNEIVVPASTLTPSKEYNCLFGATLEVMVHTDGVNLATANPPNEGVWIHEKGEIAEKHFSVCVILG